jgi:hypothetical protein
MKIIAKVAVTPFFGIQVSSKLCPAERARAVMGYRKKRRDKKTGRM